ncbi:hypothetical protein AO268_29980 [Pseudomonas sp. ICMP 8385]|nr:hypothetical protein AO268_29980 [Pseudomonas sp. ICMP 8385]
MVHGKSPSAIPTFLILPHAAKKRILPLHRIGTQSVPGGIPTRSVGTILILMCMGIILQLFQPFIKPSSNRPPVVMCKS